jgi:hypothetical protein
MNELSERRLVENESLFRHHNNKHKKRLQRAYPGSDSDLTAEFYCECSDRNCHDRINMSVEEFEAAHKSAKQFIALPGHENNSIEEVARKGEGYNVVQKHTDPAEAS